MTDKVIQHQRIAASAFIFHHQKALLLRRADNDDFLPGYWEIVGGKIEWGEDPLAGLIREVKEESGLDIKPLQPFYVWDYINKQAQRHLVEIAIISKIIGDNKVTLSHEHQDSRWINESDLDQINPITDNMKKLVIKGFEVVTIGEYPNLRTAFSN